MTPHYMKLAAPSPCLPRIVVVLAAALLTILGRVEAANIYYAVSPKLSDVSAAIDQASDGDTVVVPAGTVSWTSSLTVTKGISIKGATTVDTSTASGVANDLTVILDDIVRSPQGSAQMIHVGPLSSSQFFRFWIDSFGYNFNHL